MKYHTRIPLLLMCCLLAVTVLDLTIGTGTTHARSIQASHQAAQVYVVQEGTAAAYRRGTAQAVCPAKYTVVNGGVILAPGTANRTIVASVAFWQSSSSGWTGIVQNYGGTSLKFTTYVICKL